MEEPFSFSNNDFSGAARQKRRAARAQAPEPAQARSAWNRLRWNHPTYASRPILPCCRKNVNRPNFHPPRKPTFVLRRNYVGPEAERY